MQQPHEIACACADKSRALNMAVYCEHTDIVRMLRIAPKYPAHADASDSRALIIACESGRWDIVEMLMKAPRYHDRVVQK